MFGASWVRSLSVRATAIFVRSASGEISPPRATQALEFAQGVRVTGLVISREGILRPVRPLSRSKRLSRLRLEIVFHNEADPFGMRLQVDHMSSIVSASRYSICRT